MGKAQTGFLTTFSRYEEWRGKRIQILPRELDRKLAGMYESPWSLARATYPRFATVFAELAPELAKAPSVLSAGDLHPENFGTWRDRAGRLTWGVDNLDEIDLLPYTADLVRLASTALLAIDAGLLALDPDAASAAIEQGWRERVAARAPKPFVLGAEHPALYEIAAPALRDPVSFETDLAALPAFERALPKPATRMLAAVTPPGDWRPSLLSADPPLPGLGARRILAAGPLDGGLLVREIRQVPGPVSMWATPRRVQVAGLVGALEAARGTAAEPFRRQSRKWIVRPLYGDVTALQLSAAISPTQAQALLEAMGAEAANLHLTPVEEAAGRKALRKDAKDRPEGWLAGAAARFADAARADFAEWSEANPELS